MRLTKTTGWSLGTAGLCVAVAAGGWFGLAEPQRAAAAESRAATVSAEDTNAALRQSIDQLRQQFADLPAQQAELAAIRQAIPEDPQLAQLVRDLTLRSADAGTTLVSVTTGVPVAVVDAAAGVVAAPAPEASEGAEEPADEPSAAPSAEPSAGTDPAAAGAPGEVVVEAQPVLAAVPVVITTTGDFGASTLYLKNVQADIPRALLVDSLILTVLEGEDIEPGTVQTVITGRVFVFLDPTEVPVPPPALSVEPSTETSDG